MEILGVGIDFILVYGLAFVAMVLGVTVTWQAYRGYRRHRVRPMLFLTIGLAFITVVSFFVNIIIQPVVMRLFSAQMATRVFPITEYTTEIIGLLFVLYSLYSREERSRRSAD